MIYIMTPADKLPDTFPGLCSTFLPPERTRQMMAYAGIRDRKLCAAAYVLLVYALKKEGLFTGMPVFEYGPSQKPFLANYPGIHFNISHCEGAVVCAVSSQPVGIDIEKVGEYDDRMARYICNEREYSWVTGVPGMEALRFTEMWTRKESNVKCMGTGINDHPVLMESGGCRVWYYSNEHDQYIISLKQCSKQPIP